MEKKTSLQAQFGEPVAKFFRAQAATPEPVAIEPVAYMIWSPFSGPAQFTTDKSAPVRTAQRADYTCTPLYAHPPEHTTADAPNREAGGVDSPLLTSAVGVPDVAELVKELTDAGGDYRALVRNKKAADALTSQAARIAELEAERDAMRVDYENACKLVAKMHHAAPGSITGPVVGVVEDVAAMAAERDVYKAMCEEFEQLLRRSMSYTHTVTDANPCPHKSLLNEESVAALAKYEAMKGSNT